MDGFKLERFVEAQDGVYAQVVAELRAGAKRTHWMWFCFPQMRGLGSSAMAERYAISGIEEAQAYLQHPVLGERLLECTGLVNAVEGKGLSEIFGYPDDLKFHSSMTLFAQADTNAVASVFRQALRKYFDRREDEATVRLLGL